jgi:hypothetical protein
MVLDQANSGVAISKRPSIHSKSNPITISEAGGQLYVPGFFRLTAYVAGGLVLDIFIAEAGGEIILSASLSLNANVKAPLKVRYSSKRVQRQGDLEMNLLLKLLLCLSARVGLSRFLEVQGYYRKDVAPCGISVWLGSISQDNKTAFIFVGEWFGTAGVWLYR